MSWADLPATSIRDDGAKVMAYPTNDGIEYWSYPPNWRPRCELTALGPYETIGQAKYALDTYLNLEMPDEHHHEP